MSPYSWIGLGHQHGSRFIVLGRLSSITSRFSGKEPVLLPWGSQSFLLGSGECLSVNIDA